MLLYLEQEWSYDRFHEKADRIYRLVDDKQTPKATLRNASTAMPVAPALVEDFPEIESEVFFGGPVQTDTIHYIHTAGDFLDDSVKIVNNVYWGGSFEKLKFLIDTQLITKDDIRFFVGYSGWSSGQLIQEMERGSWVPAPMFANYLFKSDPNRLWKTVMHNKGNAYTVIAQMPDTVDWN